ncbi:glycosyltransferase family 2 protein [Methylosinus sporium]|uniref:Glycosyltransferase family 2 protein n=1 Tax=Methylosinus sporium TaxID=428 RepID=A0A549T4E1_METSR|nr:MULTISPECIES: glycosyltransferase family 2 protein [Methylosinus]MBU3889221.1 glycosyltransferase family 2 protein [Methylosinus sp. KRF6]TRL36650.1 glycosyltransferase family 2 protein [Methylosinus sporium]
MDDKAENPPPEISVAIPVFNEAANLRPLVARLKPVLERCAASFEIVFVDDGSSDETLAGLRELHEEDARVKAVSFSRNFGKEIAIAAALDHSRGAAVVLMDADLQHPPETIAQFVAKWREGYKNVYGVRRDRAGEPLLRSLFANLFYGLFDRFGETPLPRGAGDFRLLDRQAIDALSRMRERARFSKGLFAWIGFKSIGVPFEVEERASGRSKFNYAKLVRFALDGLMSFSSVPLKVWAVIGITVSTFALAMAAYYFWRTVFYGVDVPGYASLIVSIAFLGGMQLFSLGVLGEYIALIFAEVKGRPLYLVAERVGVEEQ